MKQFYFIKFIFSGGLIFNIMANSEKLDKYQLSQNIRTKAHMLDIATRTLHPDLKQKEIEKEELISYLSEWELREFNEGADIL